MSGTVLRDPRIYHKTSARVLPSILAEGLRCRRSEGDRKTDRARWLNEYLDRLRPRRLVERGLCRGECNYGYLGIEGKIFDVDSGALIDPDSWKVAEGEAKLRLTVSPSVAFVSDLELAELAHTYWSRVVGLSEPMAHYVLAGSALVSGDATGRRPERLERVEVLLAADVPSRAIERL